MSSRQPLRCAVAFLAFAAHNAEEALYTRDWALANMSFLRRYAGEGLAATWAGAGFRDSLLGLSLLLLALSILAARAPARGFAIYLLLGILAVFSANALFPHIAVAVALRAYVPGVITAIAIVLPVAAWVYISTLRAGYATGRGSFTAAAVGTALYAAIASVVVLRASQNAGP